jgi:hypothetical protein
VPEQPDGLDGHVDSLCGSLLGKDCAQPFDVGAGHLELDRRHRVARHPHDPVDVRAGVGDPAGDGGNRARLERPAENRHVRATRRVPVGITFASDELDVHAEPGGRTFGGLAQLSELAWGSEQDAEHQPAAQHDLLDVEHVDAER